MSKFYNFILLGAPGSGKGTQGELIAKKFNLLRISPGEILRKMVQDKQNDKLSETISKYINGGNLVPIEIINEVLISYIDLNKNNYLGIIFDGYPRSLEQDDFLVSNIATNGLDAVIYLEMSLDNLLDRLIYRQICDNCGAVFNIKHKPSKKGDNCDQCGSILTKRNDDNNEEIIKNRFTVFKEQSFPIIQKYQKLNSLITIDANQNINTLSDKMNDILNKIIQ